jgi:SAM-dependent methyltransferase
MRRVLRPGGLLLVGDWLRGEGGHLDAQVDEFVQAAGGAFTMISLEQLAQIARDVGFIDIETRDRRDWYLEEAREELERIPEEEREFWEVLVASLEKGAMRPGHIRARTPA